MGEGDPDSPFEYHGEWNAALARLFLLAKRAGDAKAAEVALEYLKGHLGKTLARHLTLAGSLEWDSQERWIDALCSGVPECRASGVFLLRVEVTWADRPGQREWYKEPFEYELLLDPVTGAFRRYHPVRGPAAIGGEGTDPGAAAGLAGGGRVGVRVLLGKARRTSCCRPGPQVGFSGFTRGIGDIPSCFRCRDCVKHAFAARPVDAPWD